MYQFDSISDLNRTQITSILGTSISILKESRTLRLVILTYQFCYLYCRFCSYLRGIAFSCIIATVDIKWTFFFGTNARICMRDRGYLLVSDCSSGKNRVKNGGNQFVCRPHTNEIYNKKYILNGVWLYDTSLIVTLRFY